MSISRRTVFQFGQSTTYIGKTKFEGYVKPISNEGEGESFIKQVQMNNKGAAHVPYVYVLGDTQAIQKYSDDKDVTGVAGIPILEKIKKQGITNIAVAVVRGYGGAKSCLAKRELIQGYLQAFQIALQKALVIEERTMKLLVAGVAYKNIEIILNRLSEENYMISETIYLENVFISIFIELERVEKLTALLNQLTNGKVDIQLKKERKVRVVNGKVIGFIDRAVVQLKLYLGFKRETGLTKINIETVQGDTVKSLFTKAGLAEFVEHRLLTSRGELKSNVLISINKNKIENAMAFENTIVEDGDLVECMPILAGG